MKKSLINALAAISVLSATAALAQQTMHQAKGKVTKIDAAASVVTLAHEPVKSLNWPAMTMGFQVKDKKVLDNLAVGKTVDFEFAQGDKGYINSNVK
jgi:Cu(I)/Ag(I) efflux system protein CusF